MSGICCPLREITHNISKGWIGLEDDAYHRSSVLEILQSHWILYVAISLGNNSVCESFYILFLKSSKIHVLLLLTPAT